MIAALLLTGVRPLGAQGLADYDYEDLEFRGIGAEVGWVWPAKIEAATAFGLQLDLGFIGPRIRISPSASYWSSSLRESEVDRLAERFLLLCERQIDVICPETLDLGEVKLSDLELALNAHFLLLGNRTVSPFVGFALGLHLLNGSGDFIDDTFVEDRLDTVSPGLGPLLGVNVRLAPALHLGTEARFMLASDVRYASVSVGGVWRLPTPARSANPVLQRERGR